MGNNLTGDGARIWGLHVQGFCVSRIASLVGCAESYVRGVVAGAWLEDKLDVKRPKNG